ncbi:MAG: efflux RND transporter periplasmic adaptor subunit [Betaproteobacteria bacterium]|nr:efflux RND transporter periplasmic adaptor subunit [Betaproteobacteria bacterium]
MNLRIPTLCLILAALVCACGKDAPKASPDAAAKPAPAVQAKILEAQPQRVPMRLELVGQVEGSKEVEVRARVAGILHKRLYTEGDVVRAGAPLFQIDPAPFEIALAQARAQLAQERARNEQSRREAARLKQLADEKAISQKEYDDATSALKLSDATLQVVEANIKQAELNLSYTLVTAPVAGASGRAARSEGSLISTGADSLLTTLNQIDPIWVRFSLSDSDLAKLPGGRLARGAGTELKLVLPDGSTYAENGRLNFTATQIDPKLATQQLRAEFANPRRQLLPGQFVRVLLVAGERDNVFLVPQPAVLQTEKGSLVFVLDAQSKAALRPVQVGPWVGADWMILGGLKPGDRVIVDNLLKIRPGTQVSAAPPASSAAAPSNASAAKK